jgi:hypothetical protein
MIIISQTKYYVWSSLLFLVLIYLSFIGHFADPVPKLLRDISLYILIASVVINIGIITTGVINLSMKYGKIAYFIALIGFIGWGVANTVSSENLNGIFLVIFYLSFIVSFIVGIVAFTKSEKGIAKYSSVLLVGKIGVLYVCMFITWMISGGGF